MAESHKTSGVNFGSIWHMMLKYVFELDPDLQHEDLVCIICKKLMIDAYQSGCGCQYCYQCIRNHLSSVNKFCPGGKKECNEDFLVIDRDVTRNIRMNRNISKLVVLCPYQGCPYKTELAQMEDHLRVCTKQPTQCPYVRIGCEDNGASKENVLTHLRDEVFTHSQLLIELIQNLKNEVDVLKVDCERNKYQVENVKEELRLKAIEIGNLKVESVRKEDRIKRLEMDFDTLKERLKDGNEGDAGRRPTESEVEEECEQSQNPDVDFLWKIDQWRHKCKNMPPKGIYSPSFHSNDYKLCLCLYVYEGIIQLNCYIKRGQRDDRLQWPLRRAITISILNQETMIPHKSVTFHRDTYNDKSAFDKPRSDINSYIGAWPFILQSAIKDEPSIIVDDSILVCCVLSDS